MPENIRVLTGRRAYEFNPDDLRLSMLSTKPLQDQIQQLFQFQVSGMGAPIPTFGEVQATLPPGMVFNMGRWISPDGQIVPIRFLHLEPQRVVIDVAGHSSDIGGIFDLMRYAVSEIQAAAGSPIIGEPRRILDYSEISAQFSFPLDAIFAKPLRKLFAEAAGTTTAHGKKSSLVPTIAIQTQPIGQVIQAIAAPNDNHAFTLALRAGTRPEEHIYFSGAPLDSEKHLIYLTDLEEAFHMKG